MKRVLYKYILTTLFAGVISFSFAQTVASYKLAEIAPFFNQYRVSNKTIPELSEIKNKKLMVILLNDKAYDSAIIDAVSSQWTLSEYEFAAKDITSEKISKDYNYLVPLDYNINGYSIGNKEIIKSLCFLTGDNVKYNFIKLNSTLLYLSVPYDYFGSEKNFPDIYWKLPLLVKNIENHILFYDTLKLKDYTGMKQAKLGSYINSNFVDGFGKMKCKTLLIDKDKKFLPATEMFAKKYPFKFEYVEKSVIQKAILDHNPKYVVFDPVISIPEWYFVYDAESYSLLYYYYRANVTIHVGAGGGFSTKNLKNNMYLDPFTGLKSNQECSNLPIETPVKENKQAQAPSATSPPASNPESVKTPEPVQNTSAISDKQLSSEEIEAINKRIKLAEEKAAYYKELRGKFEEDSKRKSTESPKENSQKTDQESQFDKNKMTKKTTAEEDFNSIFK